MRLAYLSMDLGVPVLGSKGASAHVRGLAEALHQGGHDVLVLASHVGSGGAEELACPVVEVAPSDELASTRGSWLARSNRERAFSLDLADMAFAPAFARDVASHLERFRPEAIYERYTLFGTAGVKLAARFGVPLVLEVNAPLPFERRRTFGIGLHAAAINCERSILRAADHVCVVSTWLERFVREQGVDAVTILRNAADPVLFRSATRSPWRERHAWRDAFVVGCVGGMKPWHGLQAVVEAVALLRHTDDRFRLVLVGDGPELNGVRAQISSLGLSDGVLVPGGVPHAAVPEWIAGMDVCVVPLAPDAPNYYCPVKLFEYMAAGRAIVAARKGEAATVIENGVSGLLYEPGDVAGLASQLRRIAHDTDLRQRLGASALAQALTRHTWAARAAAVVEIIERARSPIDDGPDLDALVGDSA